MSYLKRIENLQNHLLGDNINFLILDEPVSLFYLTGLHLSSAKMIVGQNSSSLFVDGRYIEVAMKKAPCKVILIEGDSQSDFLLEHASQKTKVAFDGDSFTYSAYENLKTFLLHLEKTSKLSFELVSLKNPLRDIRVIKTQDEISFLRKAAGVNWKGFEYICSKLKVGVSEKSLALGYELFCREHGAERLSFEPIICFGANSAMPHHHSDETTLKANDIVLIDIGVVVDNYNSDFTRVVFFGERDPLLDNFYSIIKRAHSKALSLCKPGVHVGDIDKAARDLITQEGYGKEFLHSLGHGVGLEVHEFPRLRFDGADKDAILRPGMVITIEPGIYKAGLGGVRYEDTILITKDGYENFYAST